MNEWTKVRDCALRLLARRDHSAAELKRKLDQRGFSSETCEGVIEWLAEKGYLDDRRFAQRWAEAALASGRCFGLRLRYELQQRGVDAGLAADVVKELTIDVDESLAVRAMAERRFPGFDPLTATDREKQRIFNFIQRRGFSPGVIYSFFRGAIDE